MSFRSMVRLKARQWLWFFGLWIAGLAVTITLVYAVRWTMGL